MEFSRPVALDRIGAVATEHVVEATPDELSAVTTRLQITAVNRLRCRFRLRRMSDAVISGDGKLEADVVQVCVVSLDEFPQRVEESFAVEFVPAGSESDDPDPETPDQIPYAASLIDLGEAAVEQLALALDPYPKKPGAELEPTEVEVRGPFDGLSALRIKQ